MSTGALLLIAVFVIVFLLMLWRDRATFTKRAEREREAARQATQHIIDSLANDSTRDDSRASQSRQRKPQHERLTAHEAGRRSAASPPANRSTP